MKHNHLFKKIAALSLSAVLTAGALTACSGSGTVSSDEDNSSEKSTVTYRTVDEIKQSGKVIIGVFSDKAPFGYVDENGKYQGYDVYFAERIGKDLGVDIEYVSTDPASRVEYAATGKVDIVLANFTVTDERAEKVDFALPYMKVKLGVVSPDSAVVTSVDDLKDKTLIVVKGTTAETYFEKNEPDVKLQKYDEYADAYNALLQGRGDAFSTDNTEVRAWAILNPGYTVGIDALGSADTIAPAVQKGNSSLLDWLNDEIKALGNENFFHADYEATLASVYGSAANPDSLVVEGGVVD